MPIEGQTTLSQLARNLGKLAAAASVPDRLTLRVVAYPAANGQWLDFASALWLGGFGDPADPETFAIPGKLYVANQSRAATAVADAAALRKLLDDWAPAQQRVVLGEYDESINVSRMSSATQWNDWPCWRVELSRAGTASVHDPPPPPGHVRIRGTRYSRDTIGAFAAAWTGVHAVGHRNTPDHATHLVIPDRRARIIDAKWNGGMLEVTIEANHGIAYDVQVAVNVGRDDSAWAEAPVVDSVARIAVSRSAASIRLSLLGEDDFRYDECWETPRGPKGRFALLERDHVPARTPDFAPLPDLPAQAAGMHSFDKEPRAIQRVNNSTESDAPAHPGSHETRAASRSGTGKDQPLMFDDGVRQLARRMYGASLPERTRHLDRELQRVKEEMVKRGMLRSGMTEQRVNEVLSEELRSRVRLGWDAVQRVIAAGGLIPDSAMAEAVGEELGIIGRQAAETLLAHIRGPVTPWGIHVAALDGVLGEALNSVKAEVDLAVLAGRSGTWASVSGSSHPVSQPPEVYEYDVFISHASEDKADAAEPLARALSSVLRVWYDRDVLAIGDSLRQSIDRGLARSRYGIVILSPHFFRKHWPQQELNGLATREVGGQKVILPVWHHVSFDDVRAASPILADRIAGSTADGIAPLAQELIGVVRGKP
jgi:hypothetical protein